MTKTKDEPIQIIKFSKYQALFSIIVPLALYESVVNLIKQGILNRDFRWYILFGIVVSYILCESRVKNVLVTLLIKSLNMNVSMRGKFG